MKNMFVALIVGYVIGAKTGGQELDQLGESISALLGTDEFADVLASARAQAGSTLRQLASMLDGEGHRTDAGGDLVHKVRTLVGTD
jgi:ABC-type transporter Mla subunit MlaD